jgi:hypothetical protein
LGGKVQFLGGKIPANFQLFNFLERIPSSSPTSHHIYVTAATKKNIFDKLKQRRSILISIMEIFEIISAIQHQPQKQKNKKKHHAIRANHASISNEKIML